MPLFHNRLAFVHVPPRHLPLSLAGVVAAGLNSSRKTLPCRFFYDAVGSQIFEDICNLPEYYLTRTERALLEKNADAMIAAVGDNPLLIEFGSGSSCKTRLLIEAALERHGRLHYIPIDISADFLRDSAHTLLGDYESLHITALAAEYNDAIAAVPTHDGPRLFLFLGSNIGNFEPQEAARFLTHVRSSMGPHDKMLLGVDLVKDTAVLEAAYNDPGGVTAAFNKNLLVRINRELDADFDVNAFHHTAPFVPDKSRIEMRLVSKRSQTVRIGALKQEFAFETNEILHTENSHKHTLPGFAAIAQEAGLTMQQCWTDEREWFAVVLLGANAEAQQAMY